MNHNPEEEQVNTEVSTEVDGVQETSESQSKVSGVDVSETELDAQDAAPESVRRGRILIGVILVLAAVAITVLIIAPPLGWKPVQKQADNYRLSEAVQVVEHGSSASYELRYAPVVLPMDYRLHIEQKTDYEGHSTKANLDAVIRMMPWRGEAAEHRVILKVNDVDVHIFDDGREVSLASAGAMLSGISLFSVLDETRGLGTIVPDANINPQVGRVLFMMLDSVRFLWPGLPEVKVGEGASWDWQGLSGKDDDASMKARVHLSTQEGSPEISMDYGLHSKVSGQDVSVGGGHGRIRLESGTVEWGEFSLERKQSSGLVPFKHQTVNVTWSHTDSWFMIMHQSEAYWHRR